MKPTSWRDKAAEALRRMDRFSHHGSREMDKKAFIRSLHQPYITRTEMYVQRAALECANLVSEMVDIDRDIWQTKFVSAIRNNMIAAIKEASPTALPDRVKEGGE